MTSRRARWAALFLSLLASLLVAPALAVPAQAVGGDPDADADSPREVAEQALETVQDLVEAPVTPADPAMGSPVEGKDLTLALRDLAVAQHALPKSQRKVAARLLARPDDSASECFADGDLACYGANPTRRTCNAFVCVHWVSTGTNAIPTENDGPGGAFPGTRGGLPDYVEFTLTTMTQIAVTYARAGYKKPVTDGSAGGSSLPDVYLGNVGNAGVYGYCTTDRDVKGHVGAPAYCVLDNNYAEFGISPQAALRVTAAHEYFHAVQFAYDVNEDAWIMEATASWVEDEMYDSINDNRSYLPYGPLGRPSQALDAFSDQGAEPYGTWIFFRYLSERFPATTAGLPTIVLDIWRRLGSGGPTDTGNVYSLQGLSGALAARGTNITAQLAWFAVWNRRPSVYEEGAAYRPAPVRRTSTLSSAARTAHAVFSLPRLSAGTYRWNRGKGAGSKITFGIDANTKAIGGAVIVSIKRKNRSVTSTYLTLNATGDRTVSYAFGSGTQWIELTVVSGDTRYRCWQGQDYQHTCQGTPVASALRQVITARATG